MSRMCFRLVVMQFGVQALAAFESSSLKAELRTSDVLKDLTQITAGSVCIDPDLFSEVLRTLSQRAYEETTGKCARSVGTNIARLSQAQVLFI